MSEQAIKSATYEDLLDLPENMVGEIIDGELFAFPRPSPKHANISSSLQGHIWKPYQFGRDQGPGGWWILFEPELRLGKHTLVPDIAGWKKERLPALPDTNWLSIAPDWICEILSPSTMRTDRIKKMPIYARHGVSYLWMVNPMQKIFEVFRVESGKWLLIHTFMDDDRVCAEPFPDVEIDLKYLWAESPSA